MSKFKFLFLIVSLTSFIFSCNNTSERQNNRQLAITYYPNNQIKELVIADPMDKAKKAVYLFNENGQIEEIQRLNGKHRDGEQLWFYPSGKLDRKISKKNGISYGNAYYYYDNTGAVKSFRYFRDGREVLFGCEYWGDSMDLLKSSLHFNDSGQIYYKKNFDKNGQFISEEGTRR